MSWLNSPLEVIPQHRAKVRTDWDISKARFCVCVFSNSVLDLLIRLLHQPARAAMMFLIHRSLPQSVKTSMYQSKCSHLLYFTAEMWLGIGVQCFFIYLFLFSCKHNVMYFYILSLSLSVFVCLNRFLSNTTIFIQGFP